MNFIKQTPHADEEAQGLARIAELGKIRVVEVLSHDNQSITLEKIETEEPTKGFWLKFGEQFADFHSVRQTQFGFDFDNHCGPTPQPNPKADPTQITWADYFIKFRLEHMLKQSRLRSNVQLHELFEDHRASIHERLSHVNEAPSLVHGDFWSGNFLCAQGQVPVLIDPAPYWGHREVDLAMSELFGGFSPDFYVSYNRRLPLDPGYASRKDIYQLYHLLNHWVIFGDSYASQTLRLFLRLDFTSEE